MSDFKKLFNELASKPGISSKFISGLSGPETAPHALEKLQLVSDVIDCLEGSYKPQGISRWFGRTRWQLGQKTPRELLALPWGTEGSVQKKVLRLAQALKGQ